jgi:hypothetical protein
MIKVATIKLLLLGALVIASMARAAAAFTLFAAEDEAKQHCPSDVVVWLNLPTHIYHWKGMRWYGNIKNGAYVCKTEADQNGNRGTLDGE